MNQRDIREHIALALDDSYRKNMGQRAERHRVLFDSEAANAALSVVMEALDDPDLIEEIVSICQMDRNYDVYHDMIMKAIKQHLENGGAR